MTEEFQYDTYCGLYCGACDIMLAYRRGQNAGREPAWEELPERLRALNRLSEISCHGCKSDQVFAGCKKCPIRPCASKRGVETCGQCPKYPCFTHALFKLVKRMMRFDRKLPHQKIMAGNLKRYRDIGREAWLAEQQGVWQCPDCGQSFSWYQEACAKCGKKLDGIKDYQQPE